MRRRDDNRPVMINHFALEFHDTHWRQVPRDPPSSGLSLRLLVNDQDVIQRCVLGRLIHP